MWVSTAATVGTHLVNKTYTDTAFQPVGAYLLVSTNSLTNYYDKTASDARYQAAFINYAPVASPTFTGVSTFNSSVALNYGVEVNGWLYMMNVGIHQSGICYANSVNVLVKWSNINRFDW